MLHSPKASNWVDRGEPPERKLYQLIAHFLDEPAATKSPAPWLVEAARDIVGMVSADASEVQLAGYLRRLATSRGRAVMDAAPAPLYAVALWHAVKAAEVRDRAERIIRQVAEGRARNDLPVSDWIAERLLSPEELQIHRRQRDAKAEPE